MNCMRTAVLSLHFTTPCASSSFHSRSATATCCQSKVNPPVSPTPPSFRQFPLVFPNGSRTTLSTAATVMMSTISCTSGAPPRKKVKATPVLLKLSTVNAAALPSPLPSPHRSPLRYSRYYHQTSGMTWPSAPPTAPSGASSPQPQLRRWCSLARSVIYSFVFEPRVVDELRRHG